MPEPTSTTGFFASLMSTPEGSKASLFIGGLLGGLIKLAFQKQVSIRAAWIPLLALAVLADLAASPIAGAMGKPEYSFGSSVVIGIFGVEFVAMCHRMLAKLDLAAIVGDGLRNIFSAIASRITGGKE